MSIQDKIKAQIENNSIILYMKGTPQFPQCGFSSKAVHLLKSSGVDNFAFVNVLEDDDIRQGIKEYSEWPTIPQLYVNNKFIGGCDIMTEMFQTGELQALVKSI